MKNLIAVLYSKYIVGVDPSKVLPPIAAQMIAAVATLYEAHFPTWIFWSSTAAFFVFSVWSALVYPKTDLQMSSDLKGKQAAVMTVANEVIGNLAGADAAAMAARVEGVALPLVDKVLTTDAKTSTTVTASVTDAPPVVEESSAVTPFAEHQQAAVDAMVEPPLTVPTATAKAAIVVPPAEFTLTPIRK